MALRILFLIFTNVIATLCLKNGSLTFVIDNTGSMNKDINSVIRGSKSIMDVIFRSGSSQISDMVLVTFNDPGYKLHVHSTIRSEIEDTLNSIANVYGGGDCPEMSLTGLEAGLRESLPHSYVFLFTDDVAKDATENRINTIQNLCQEKEIIVYFVITPNPGCAPSRIKDFTTYYTIANFSTGQVLRLNDKTDVTKIIPAINETVTGDRHVITSVVIPSYQWSSIPFDIDDQTQYAIASTSGKDVQFRLKNANNDLIANFLPIVWMDNVKVVKIEKPGKYIANVYSKSAASVVVFGRTDFTFEPAFSVRRVQSFEEAEKKLYEGLETFLWVSVHDQKHAVDIESAALFNMEEKLIEELPLKKVYGDVYTTTAFIPPNSIFKIAVKGIIKKTGDEITRFAKLPVEPIRSKQGPPKIIIPDGETIYTAVVGDKVLRIPCIAIGNPKPSISWLKGDNKMDKGDDYQSVENDTLVIQKIIAENQINYTCVASNSYGENKVRVAVDIINTVADNKGKQLYVLKDDHTTLNCSLPISDTDSVRWFKNGYFISEGPQKDIMKASVVDDGNYTCRVSNAGGSENGETIEVIVDAPPKNYYNENPTVINWKGSKNFINCGIDVYKPDVEIQWFQNGKKLKENYMDLYYSTFGNYTCKVSNYFGTVNNSFIVTSEGCLLDIDAAQKKLPLIVDASSKLPSFSLNEHFVTIPTGTRMTWICDGFKNFGGTKENIVTCFQEDQYVINGQKYKFSDLLCSNEIKAQLKDIRNTCAEENTKLMQIGYSTKKFVEVFETCYNTQQRVPVYTKIHTATSEANNVNKEKYIYGESLNKTAPEHRYASKYPNCYYTKGPLINAEDINFGIPQKSISEMRHYTDILYLSCDDESHWKQLEKDVRKSIAENTDVQYTIWSGASKWESKDELSVTRYLWKVIKNTKSMDSVVVVTVNDPRPLESEDRLCGREEECSESWIELSDWPTYCCQVSDFSKAFNLPESIFA